MRAVSRHPGSGALLMVASICYATWVLGHVLNAQLSPYTSYASELAAVGEPLSWFFRIGDLFAGALVTAGSLAMWTRTLHGPHRTGWAALVVFGAVTMVDAVSPLSCAATVDAACAARENALQVPPSHLTHMATSVIVGIAILVAMVCLSLPHGRSLVVAPRWPGLLTALAGVYGVTLLWTVLASFHIGPLGHTLGVAQRISLGAASGWLLTVGAGCVAGLRRPIVSR